MAQALDFFRKPQRNSDTGIEENHECNDVQPVWEPGFEVGITELRYRLTYPIGIFRSWFYNDN